MITLSTKTMDVRGTKSTKLYSKIYSSHMKLVSSLCLLMVRLKTKQRSRLTNIEIERHENYI